MATALQTPADRDKIPENERFAHALRELADFYEAHPCLPTPSIFESWDSLYLFLSDDSEKAKAQIRAFGGFAKSFTDDYWTAKKTIAGINLALTGKRQTVCVRKVIGVRTIPERVIPAQPEQVVPEHTEEIVEWDCRPVLGGER